MQTSENLNTHPKVKWKMCISELEIETGVTCNLSMIFNSLFNVNVPIEHCLGHEVRENVSSLYQDETAGL